jgi:hypothetical protein
MNRFLSLIGVCLFATAAGCTAPASSMGSGSFWESERGAELNDSLDRTGSHVAKFEKQAEAEIKREVE